MNKFMEAATLEMLKPTCPICTHNYSGSRGSLRPYCLPCGHTVCRMCAMSPNGSGLLSSNSTNPKCPICRVHYDRSKAVVNYVLEEQIEIVNQQEAEMNKSTAGMHLCLDCRCTFVRSANHILSAVHAAHKTLSLEKLGQEHMEMVVWMADAIGDSKNCVQRMKLVLQAVLSLAATYQNCVKDIEAAIEMNPDSWADPVWKHFDKLISSGDSESVDHITASLKMVKVFQSMIGPETLCTYLCIKKQGLEACRVNSLDPTKQVAAQSLEEQIKKIEEAIQLISHESESSLILLPGTLTRSLIDVENFEVCKVIRKASDPQLDSTRLCLDCKVPFIYSTEKSLGLDHEKHMNIEIGKISEASKQELFWIADFIRNPIEGFERMRKFLQAILTVAAHYQFCVGSLVEGFNKQPREWIEALWNSLIMSRIGNNHTPPESLKTMSRIRFIQASLSSAMLLHNMPLLLNPEAVDEAKSIFQSERKTAYGCSPGPGLAKMLSELSLKVVPMSDEELAARNIVAAH